MATKKNISNLVINKVENQEVYDYMVTNNLINEDELYFVQGEGASGAGVFFGTCATVASKSAKVVTTTTGDFALKEGAIVYVLFNNSNKSTSRITLNVDGTGNTTVNLSPTDGIVFAAKQVICFVYDGESFRVQGGSLATTTYYGLTKLSSSTSSTSTTLAATPSAVKEAYDLANTANTAVNNTETWTFTLSDGTTVTKQVVVK